VVVEGIRNRTKGAGVVGSIGGRGGRREKRNGDVGGWEGKARDRRGGSGIISWGGGIKTSSGGGIFVEHRARA